MNDATDARPGSGPRPGRGANVARRRAVVAGTAGTIGVLGLALAAPTLLEQVPPPAEIAALPAGVQVLLLLVNPLLFTWIAAWAGSRFAPGAGLRFPSADAAVDGYGLVPGALSNAVRRSWALAVSAGAALGAATALADRIVLSPLLPDAWRAVIAGEPYPDGASLLSALLHGGLTEEVILRWGVMSTAAVLFARVARSRPDGKGVPRAAASRPRVMWMAVVVAAMVFAAGHLPAAAGIAPIDGAVIVRILLLNVAGGILFGWLYWKRGLEAAIMAHMGAHLSMWTVAFLTR